MAHLKEGYSLILQSHAVQGEVLAVLHNVKYYLVLFLFFLACPFIFRCPKKLSENFITCVALIILALTYGAMPKFDFQDSNITTLHRAIKQVSIRERLADDVSDNSLLHGIALKQETLPNIIMIEWESVSAEYLKLFNQEGTIEAPAIERLAKDSLVSYQHYAVNGGSSTNSDWSILTGLYPASAGETAVAYQDSMKEKSLFYYLKERGYQTVVYYFGGGNAYQHNKIFKTAWTDFYYDIFDYPEEIGIDPLKLADVYISDLRERLTNKNDKPHFYLFRLWDPHWPYHGDPKKQQTPFERYADDVRRSDSLVEQILTVVRNSKHADNTILIVTSDHGEAFQQHEGLNVHSNHIYQELVKVPLLIYYPKVITNAIEIRRGTSHVDLLPTILDLIGGYNDQLAELDGYSLFRSLPESRSILLASSTSGEVTGLIKNGYKYMHQPARKRELLFNLDRDPKELNNLAKKEDLQTTKLRALHDKWREAAKIPLAESRYPKGADIQSLQLAVAPDSLSLSVMFNDQVIVENISDSQNINLNYRQGHNQLLIRVKDRTSDQAQLFIKLSDKEHIITPGIWWRELLLASNQEKTPEFIFPEDQNFLVSQGAPWIKVSQTMLEFKLDFEVSNSLIKVDRLNFQCDDQCTLWIDKSKVRTLDYCDDLARIDLPSGTLKEKELVIEVINHGGRGGLIFEGTILNKKIFSQTTDWQTLTDINYTKYLELLSDGKTLEWLEPIENRDYNIPAKWANQVKMLWDKRAGENSTVIFRPKY